MKRAALMETQRAARSAIVTPAGAPKWRSSRVMRAMFGFRSPRRRTTRGEEHGHHHGMTLTFPAPRSRQRDGGRGDFELLIPAASSWNEYLIRMASWPGPA